MTFGAVSTARPRPDIRWFLGQATTLLGEDSSPRLQGLTRQEAVAEFFKAGNEWLSERSDTVRDLLAWQKDNPTSPLHNLPPTLSSKLAPDQLASFQAFANVQGHIEADLGLYDRIERDLLDHPRRFMDTRLDEYALHLGVDGIGRLGDLQGALQKGDPDGRLARLRTGRRLIENAVVKAGFEADATIGEAARSGVRMRIDEFSKLHGRQPTEDDIVRIVNEETDYLRRDEHGIQAEAEPIADVQVAQAAQSEEPTPAGSQLGTASSKYYLKFDGRYLKLYDGEEVVGEWPAVSGKENFGSGRDQNKRNYGPIPEGTYDIKQSRYQSMSEWDRWWPGRWPGGTRSWGTERVWADPTKATTESGLTFGRRDMAIHGGEIPGSAGCIDLTQQMADFARKFRSLGIDLRLYVDYSLPSP